MRVFGIDPGSLITGYGVVEKHGARLVHVDNGLIRPKRDISFSERLKHIYTEIDRLLGEFKPDVVALEEAFFGKDARAAMKLGHVRGIAMLAAVSRGIEVAEYMPVHRFRARRQTAGAKGRPRDPETARGRGGRRIGRTGTCDMSLERFRNDHRD